MLRVDFCEIWKLIFHVRFHKIDSHYLGIVEWSRSCITKFISYSCQSGRFMWQSFCGNLPVLLVRKLNIYIYIYIYIYTPLPRIRTFSFFWEKCNNVGHHCDFITSVFGHNFFDTQGYGPLTRYVKLRLRMRRECRKRFPRHRGLAIPTCITARAWRTCRYVCLDR